MSETLVVEVARVKAMVNNVHIKALKARLRPKKKARRRKAMNLFVAERPKAVAMCDAHEEVSSVVVLDSGVPGQRL